MATTKEFKEYALDKLNTLDNIKCRSMMGEYLLYYNNILFGGIYDNRLLIKKTEGNKKYNLIEDVPYECAATMYLIDIDDNEILQRLIIDTINDLKS